jgi:hypothetical protein
MEGVARSSRVRSTTHFESAALAGFVAGEGSFIVTTKQPPFKDGTPRLRFVFSVTVAERDRPILEAIRHALGFGSIRAIPPRKRGHLFEVALTVASIRAHRAATIPFFESNLVASEKRHQFELWRDALNSYDSIRPTRWGKGRSPCSEPGCDKPVRGRGLCRSHYYRATGY